MHALSRLIHKRKADDPSLSYARIADLASPILTQPTVGRWANKKADSLEQLPQPEKLKALARALKVPERIVLLAAGAAAGLAMNHEFSTKFAQFLPPDIDNLPTQVTDELQCFLLTLIAAKKARTQFTTNTHSSG